MTSHFAVVGDEPAIQVRTRIAAAGRELFSSNGYDGTTVDAIAARAGVGRRTFFRHFRGKDEVIFMDHARVIASVESFLETQEDVPPLRAVSKAVHLVLRGYVDDPVVSVQCYELIRSIPALRDREIAWVSSYTRLFARYLRARLGTDPESLLIADVAAATIVTTHNHVLRNWLRGGGKGDPESDLDRDLAWVSERMTFLSPDVSDLETGQSEQGLPPQQLGHAERSQGEVVVAVFRTDGPLDEVVQRISRSL